jgi:hypothetical protein
MNKKIFMVPMIVVAIIAIFGFTKSASAYYIGQTGQDVADLQITLIEAGFDIPAITSGKADVGYFGVQTQKALAAYTASNDSGVILGAAAGPNVNVRMFLNDGLTVGRSAATSSTAASYTTVAKDFITLPSVLLWTPNVSPTITLNATSTFGYVPKVGDVARVMFLNASTTAASAITFAAQNSSVDLQFNEATGGDLVLNGLDWAELILIRQSTQKVSIIFNEFTEAD